jgi:large subunit ribosomal protein L5
MLRQNDLTSMKPRLYTKYQEEVKPGLQKEHGYANVHQVPVIKKIVVHMGVDAQQEKSALDDAMEEMKAITGRKPVVDRARKSVANFKLREGMAIGCHVTLRRDAMWEFLDRLTATALPGIRDFRGINPRSFDGRGNYSLGINDQAIFPEIELDKVKRTQGMDITIVTSAKTNDEALDLLTRMGMPFKSRKDMEALDAEKAKAKAAVEARAAIEAEAAAEAAAEAEAEAAAEVTEAKTGDETTAEEQ